MELKLGDAVAKLTLALGINQCLPCKQRQEKLNRLFTLKFIDDPRDKDAPRS